MSTSSLTRQWMHLGVGWSIRPYILSEDHYPNDCLGLCDRRNITKPLTRCERLLKRFSSLAAGKGNPMCLCHWEGYTLRISQCRQIHRASINRRFGKVFQFSPTGSKEGWTVLPGAS